MNGLINLTKTKGKPSFVWTEEAEISFQALKDAFTKAPLLLHLIWSEARILHVDACNRAAAAILSQKGADTHNHPVAFWSRKWNNLEIRYTTHDHEMLAIVEAFCHWRYYLKGANDTVVYSDHNNLKFFMSSTVLSRKQARWAEFLLRFDFKIIHKPGQKNSADAPSQRPDYLIGEDVPLNPFLRLFALEKSHWPEE